MREKEREASRGTFCSSPAQVKQNIINLAKDGETKRNALNSLRHCVETMDSSSVPRFISQISETRDKGNSRAFAISLYEDVARVHGKLIIAHIPRVMTTVVRTLSSSGSSPQLQQACARVVGAVIKYSVDDDSPAKAAEILALLCEPLLEVLAGKLEPLAGGAALCLLALVESDKWKYATDDLVADVCMKTTVALGEKTTRTVSHMQLAVALAAANSSDISSCGVSLIRSGVEALKALPTSSWQQRANAARLLTAVLPTIDRATLCEELSFTLQALDGCKHDRVSNVRWSVKEALKTAKLILSEENARRSNIGQEPLLWATTISPPPSSPRRMSIGGASADDMSPVSSTKSIRAPRSSPSSSFSSPMSVISLSPSAPSVDSHSSRPAVGPLFSSGEPAQQLRSPLRVTRPHQRVGSSFDTSSVASFNNLESPRKENLPSLDPDIKIGAPRARDAGELLLGSTGKSAPEKAAPPSQTPVPNPPVSVGEETGAKQLPMDPGVGDTCPGVALQCTDENYFGSPTTVVLPSDKDWEGHELAEGETVLVSSDDGVKAVDELMKREADDSGPNRGAARSHGLLDVSTMKHVFELKGPVAGSVTKGSSPQLVDSREVDESGPVCVSSLKTDSNDWKEPVGDLGSPFMVASPTHLRALEDSFGSQKAKGLIAAEDFLPFSTPRRLVRSLQDSFACSPISVSRLTDLDVTNLRGGELAENTTVDMDLATPTSSSTGWSVRTNPIASDGSLKSESDESDNENGRLTWKKMAPHTPPVQETENPDNDDGFRHRLMHPAAAALPMMLVAEAEEFAANVGMDLPPISSCVPERLAQNLQPGNLLDDVEIIKRNVSCSSSPLSGGLDAHACRGEDGLRNLLSDLDDQQVGDQCVDKWSCSEIPSPRSDHGAVTFLPDVREESTEPLPCLGIMSEEIMPSKRTIRSSSTFRDIIGRGWKSGRGVFSSWQFYVVVVAVPLAVFLSKVFFPSDSYHFTSGYLVPT